MLEDRILTIVRVRPLSEQELLDHNRVIASCTHKSGEITITDPSYFYSSSPSNANKITYERIFRYDHAIGETQSQDDIYNITGNKQFIDSFEGINCTILAYGQTGSGKTYTMFGEGNREDMKEEGLGIIPRLCKQMLDQRYFLLNSQSIHNNVDNTDLDRNVLQICSFSLSFYEIYNEKVHDLLSTTYDTMLCKVREHPIDGVYAENLTILAIESYEEAMHLLAEGQKRRAVAATLMNSSSSRSHAVVTIYLTQQFINSYSNNHIFRNSKICLVDLAGSEKVSMSGVTGERLVEANNINTSLSTLGTVIKKLSEDNKNQNKFVPYRDSTLTWLLKDSFNGNSKTIMLATISPAAYSYTESLNTLKYVERAKLISTKARINETSDSSAAVLKLQSTISQLQLRLDDAADIIQSQAEKLEVLQSHEEDSSPITELEAEREHNNFLTDQLERLKGVLFQRMSDDLRLEKELSETLVENAYKDTVITSLEAQLVEQQNVLDTLKHRAFSGSDKEISYMRADASRLEATIDELDTTVSSQASQLKRLEQINSTLQKSVDQKDVELKVLRTRLLAMEEQRVNKENMDLHAMIDSLSDQLHKAEDVQSSTRSDASKAFASRILAFDQEMTMLMNTNEALGIQLQQSSSEALSCRTQFDQMQSELQELRSAKKSLTVTLEITKRDFTAVSSKTSELAMSQNDLKGSLDSTRSELDVVRRERDKLRAERGDLLNTLEQLQTSKRAVHEELVLMTQQYEEGMGLLSAAQKTITGLLVDAKETRKYQVEVSTLQAALSMLREVNARMDSELVEKNKSVVASTLMIGELKGEVATLNAINESHRNEILSLRADLSDATLLLGKYRELNSYIERRMTSGNGTSMATAIAESLDELLSKKRTIEHLREENSQLLVKLEASRSAIETHAQSITEQDADLARDRILAAELDHQNEELLLAYQAIEKRNTELKSKLSQALETINEDLLISDFGDEDLYNDEVINNSIIQVTNGDALL